MYSEFGALNKWVQLGAYEDANERNSSAHRRRRDRAMARTAIPPGVVVKQENAFVMSSALVANPGHGYAHDQPHRAGNYRRHMPCALPAQAQLLTHRDLSIRHGEDHRRDSNRKLRHGQAMPSQPSWSIAPATPSWPCAPTTPVCTRWRTQGARPTPPRAFRRIHHGLCQEVRRQSSGRPPSRSTLSNVIAIPGGLTRQGGRRRHPRHRRVRFARRGRTLRSGGHRQGRRSAQVTPAISTHAPCSTCSPCAPRYAATGGEVQPVSNS